MGMGLRVGESVSARRHNCKDERATEVGMRV